MKDILTDLKWRTRNIWREISVTCSHTGSFFLTKASPVAVHLQNDRDCPLLGWLAELNSREFQESLSLWYIIPFIYLRLIEDICRWCHTKCNSDLEMSIKTSVRERPNVNLAGSTHQQHRAHKIRSRMEICCLTWRGDKSSFPIKLNELY